MCINRRQEKKIPKESHPWLTPLPQKLGTNFSYQTRITGIRTLVEHPVKLSTVGWHPLHQVKQNHHRLNQVKSFGQIHKGNMKLYLLLLQLLKGKDVVEVSCQRDTSIVVRICLVTLFLKLCDYICIFLLLRDFFGPQDGEDLS